MRIETITREIFTFDELSDDAKEKAREWYRDGALHYEWWDAVYEDAERVAAILGIEFGRKRGRNMKGEPIDAGPMIWFSGFCSQGDGASWEGDYSYSKGAAKRIREYAPQDEELHRIADELQRIQRRFFYRLEARVAQSGMYCHSGTMSVAVTDSRLSHWHNWIEDQDAENDLRDTLRSFANWIYHQLEKEHDYLMSDEAIDESIRCNEYEFTSDGELA